MTDTDTIAAVSTPPGRGGIAVVRVSGRRAAAAAAALTGLCPQPRRAYFTAFRSGDDLLDAGVLLYFKGPHSYTGEDVVEFQGHGGRMAPQRVLSAVLALPGCRQAEPGEFTQRAFLNGRLDLSAAEAVEDLISAGSERAARAALASLNGTFAAQARALGAAITDLRVRLEACLDFPEEHESFFDSGNAARELSALQARLDATLARASAGARLTEGARVVLCGAPNAGKSSLLNALAGEDKAIVTAVPGTTRDLLTVEIDLHGIPLTVTDTAGLRSRPQDEIEAIGMERARRAISQADLVLFLLDGSAPDPAAPATLTDLTAQRRRDELIVLVTKSDRARTSNLPEILQQAPLPALQCVDCSVKLPAGLSELHRVLAGRLDQLPDGDAFSARRRHVTALQTAQARLQAAARQLAHGDLVLCAQDLQSVQQQLGVITGETVTSDDLLDRIFSTFCIGK